jgi:trans-AT polyketide synthase, acyltransferase and oxidoreductase domains
MTAWLFPGQGSQRRGMGGDLFARYPELVAAADEHLGYSVAHLCRENPQDRLSRTVYAQPALFVVCALAGLARSEDAAPPAYLAGHSLGEYAALFVAGSFDFVTGVRLVQRRAELMAEALPGGMLAVVRAPADEVLAVLAEGRHEAVDVANHNAPDQVVLAGPTDALAAVADELTARGVGRPVPLRVSAAFHSRYMRPAARAFADHLAGCTLAPPRWPVLSNVTAGPYGDGPVAPALTEQIHRPVRWSDIVTRLLDDGVTEVVELGPGTVLTELWRTARRRRASAPPAAAATPAAAVRAVTVGEPGPVAPGRFAPETLGDAGFRRDHGLRYAYLAGSMYHGVSSTDLVTRMVRAGFTGFFGSGGLSVPVIEDAISRLQRDLGPAGRFGMNLLCTLDDPRRERDVVECYLRRGVRLVEASAYPQLTPQLVRWRFTGAHTDRQGRPVAVNRLIAKVSRPEVATAFFGPPPEGILAGLVAAGELTEQEARVARQLPVSHDLCVEADSGGHTDAGVALTLLPAMVELRRELAARYPEPLRVGAAGGLGSPQALAAVFVLGADFVVTGSINQCSPEAGTSDQVKDLLAALDVQDTAYAPAGDLFEIGARVQVVRKGTLFPVRANRLYQLYRQHPGLDALDARTRRGLEAEYFGRSLDAVWEQVRDHLGRRRPEEVTRAEADPRRRMALVFRWYFRHTTELALHGDAAERVNYQIHCGPAMGSFNRWVRGTDLQDWRARHVDVVAERLMTATADLLHRRFAAMTGAAPAGTDDHHSSGIPVAPRRSGVLSGRLAEGIVAADVAQL